MNRRRALHTMALGIGGFIVPPREGTARRLAPTLQPLPPMQVARAAHTLSAVGTTGVVVVGGLTGTGAEVAGAEWLDLRTLRWTTLGGALARHSHSATPLADGRILVAGGFDDRGQVTTMVERFEPTSRRFTPHGALLTGRAGHEVLRLADDHLLVVGGVAAGWTFLDRVERLDARGHATGAPPMTAAREGHAAVVLTDGRVLVCGGHRGRGAAMEVFGSTEIFDPSTNRWTAGPTMALRRHKHDVVRLPDGRVLVVGGADERDDRGAYDSTEIFEPGTGTFSPGPRLARARYKLRGTSHMLADGRLLVTGGADHAEILDLRRGRSDVVDGPRLTGLFSASLPLGPARTLVTGGYGVGRTAQAGAWVVAP